MQQDTKPIKKQNNIAGWALLLGILLIASNLRAPLTAVGSLLSYIRDDLEISNTLAGSLTTLPLLAFFIISPFASTVANRIGMEWTIFYSFVLLTVGLIIRTLSGITFLIAGTVVVGLAIGFGNVLLPGLIKMKFPLKIGLLTGLYAVFMNIFGSLASGLSLPLSRIGDWGWQGSLASWAILSVVALVVWIPQLKKKETSPTSEVSSHAIKNNIWKSPLAWYITVYMGTQSMVFFTMISWLPDILNNNGYTSDVAGWMLSLMQVAFIPFTFITPVIAERMTNQRLLAAITGILVIIGASGLLIGNAILITVAVISIGAACGSAFSLSMMFFSLRSNDGHEASKVSGMAQSFGYLIAAVGPILLGFMHDLTAAWILPLIVMGMVGIILIVSGMKSGTNEKIANVF
ncbi:MFS transporter [Lentibacillus cibarius]|uniref:MFS transporter n=1 Tax=Lentibacillus cibarius TaxID=2583219 RepID=A0A5S3R856_9BACI|nr:MFS transporter [Lentibacillus cibarius]